MRLGMHSHFQVDDDLQKRLGSFLLGMGLDASHEDSLPSVNLR